MPTEWLQLLSAWKSLPPKVRGRAKAPGQIGYAVIEKVFGPNVAGKSQFRWYYARWLLNTPEFWIWWQAQMQIEKAEVDAMIATCRREILEMGLGVQKPDKDRLAALALWLREHDPTWETKPTRVEVSDVKDKEEIETVVSAMVASMRIDVDGVVAGVPTQSKLPTISRLEEGKMGTEASG